LGDLPYLDIPKKKKGNLEALWLHLLESGKGFRQVFEAHNIYIHGGHVYFTRQGGGKITLTTLLKRESKQRFLAVLMELVFFVSPIT
jgi:hypothetical protein